MNLKRPFLTSTHLFHQEKYIEFYATITKFTIEIQLFALNWFSMARNNVDCGDTMDFIVRQAPHIEYNNRIEDKNSNKKFYVPKCNFDKR